MKVHRSTGCAPFELVLTRPPEYFAVEVQAHRGRKSVHDQRHEFTIKTEQTLANARAAQSKAEAMYKRNFDRRIRHENQEIRLWDYVFIYPHEGGK